MLEEKGFRGFKEGQYHKCTQCGDWGGYRTYVRARKCVYDYEKGVYGKDNSRRFQPMGWFCIKCKHMDIDENIPNPTKLTGDDIIKKYEEKGVKGRHRFEVKEQISPPKTTLTVREVEFLNDILKLKNDNSDWYGKHRVVFGDGDDGNGNIINKASKELFSLNPTWTYDRQRIMKSRILRKRSKILSDKEQLSNTNVELLNTVSKRLERL